MQGAEHADVPVVLQVPGNTADARCPVNAYETLVGPPGLPVVGLIALLIGAVDFIAPYPTAVILAVVLTEKGDFSALLVVAHIANRATKNAAAVGLQMELALMALGFHPPFAGGKALAVGG